MDDFYPSNQAWPPGASGLDSGGQILGSRSTAYQGQGDVSQPSPMMSNFSSTGQGRNGEVIPTPNGLANLPVIASKVPMEMFMKTVNFEAAMKNPALLQNATGMMDLQQETKKPAKEAAIDLLEHQQSIEQARLLQRFKELRTLQLQQQEVLMQQQQKQLEVLRAEQQRAQAMIAMQKDGQTADPLVDPTMTPPIRKMQQAPGFPGMARGTVLQPGYSLQMPSQQRGQLPCPVMYVPLEEETDEVKTNPDLFSDTNSQVGSQGMTEDEAYPLPESASEVDAEVAMPTQRRSDVRGQGPFSQHSRDKGKQDTNLKASRETDPDEGFGTQSFRSSGQTDNQEEEDEDDVRQTLDFKLEQYSLDDDDDNEYEDDEIEDEEQDTIKERILDEDNIPPDDRPIKPGVAGKMTFEQMIEKQLQEEQEQLQEQEDMEANQSPRRPFLKRGEGIARFGVKTNQKSNMKAQKSVSTKTRTSLLPPPKSANTSKPQTNKKVDPSKQPQAKLVLKTSPKSNKANSMKLKAGSANQKTGNRQTNESCQSRDNSQKGQIKGQKGESSDSQKKGLYGDCVQTLCANASKVPVLKLNTGQTKQPFSKPPDSIPDDASFVEKLHKREMNVEFEQEELEEFEMLETFADNASFSSNSSLVVRVLKKDKMKPTLPKVTQSPRQSVAKQIEAAARKDVAQTVAINSLQSRQQEFKPRETTKDVTNTDTQGKELKETNNSELDDTVTEDTDSESESDDSESDDEEESEETSSDDSETEVKDCGVSAGVQTDDVIHRNTTRSANAEEKELDAFFARSPSKIMTRKVASKEDRSTLNTVSNLLQKLNPSVQIQSVGTSQGHIIQQSSPYDPFNSSAFLPQGKAPIVISRDIFSSKHGASDLRKNLAVQNEDEETDDGGLEIHGKFSSPQTLSDVSSKDDGNSTDDSDTSYSALKISAKKLSGSQIPQNQKRLSSEGKFNTEKGSDSEYKEEEDEDDNDDDKFDDNEEWGNTTLKAKSPGVVLEPSGPKEGGSGNAGGDGTPPTSKLMSKLFPKLKPQPSKQQQQQEQKLQTVSNTATNDGIQSKILRDKLTELEKEIEKFRNENGNLERLRREREEGLTKLKKEIVDFEKEKNTELQRIQDYKTEETKKLKHEKKMFERYQKAARSMPDKKEREEIEMLKNQLSDLQEEMKRKETRWTNSSSRMRGKLEQLETENSELREEIKLMEKKRLEWLQWEQSGKNKTKPVAIRSTSPSREPTTAWPVINQNSADFQTTDSEEEMDPVRDKPRTGFTQTSVNPGSLHTGLHPTRTQVSVRAPHSGGMPQQTTKPNPPAKSSDGSWPSSSVKSSTAGHMADKGNFLRSSLTEEVPRQDCRATAFPQDTSMYTDTEDAPYSKDLPRKKAPKIDRVSIDKGDCHYDEVQHSDGKIERVYKTGAREILFSNGTRKEISADGLSIIVSFFNGDIKQIMPDQRIVYYYGEAQTTHSTYPDGLEILQFPNNQVEKHYPDGTKEIIFPDQTIKYLFQNGSEESIFQDGTIIRVDKNGDKTMEFPNGQREIHTQEYKRREYPDGTLKTVYPDGRQETRYSNGRIRVKDRDGNIIVDRRC